MLSTRRLLLHADWNLGTVLHIMLIETLSQKRKDGGSSPGKRIRLLIFLCRVLGEPSTDSETFFEVLKRYCFGKIALVDAARPASAEKERG